MKQSLILLACACAAAAAAPNVMLATFDGVDKATTLSWDSFNGCLYDGNSSLVFSHTCAIIKNLKVPGFASVRTSPGQVLNRAGSAVNGTLDLMLRSNTPTYTGFKFSFSAKGIPVKPQYGHGDGSFKASFQLKNQADWQLVQIPMSDFSDDWSPYTGNCDSKDPGGKQHHCCATGDLAQYCPTSVFLSALTGIKIWAEGVAGDFQIEAKWIGASNAAAPQL